MYEQGSVSEDGKRYNDETLAITNQPNYSNVWFSEDSLKGLSDLARSVAHLPGVIVEVGTWEGRTTLGLAKAAPTSQIFTIDTWEGNKTEDAHIVATVTDDSRHPTVWELFGHGKDVYGRFLANLKASGADNVVPIRGDWRTVFQGWKLPISLMFLDGDHSYEETKANIEAATPYLVPGGIICGDDIGLITVHNAVMETVGQYQFNGVWYAIRSQ